jgi:predicted transposase YdaD
VAEYLATEQPQVLNRRADMVARNVDGSLHHCEFQTSNETDFAVRMLGYYAYLVGAYGQHVVQTVLYLGREPLRLESTYISPSIKFEFEIVNLRELDAGPLLASQDWADNVLAVLAKGEPREALAAVISRLRGMESVDREQAAATLLLLSGILGMEDTVSERLKEVGMINVMENKVLGPIMQQQFELGEQKGRNEGRSEGRSEGRQAVLQELLTEKFGSLPAWAVQRLQAGSAEELHSWTKRVLLSTTLEDTLR